MSDKRIILDIDYDDENRTFDLEIFDHTDFVDIPAVNIPQSKDPEDIRKFCTAVGETIYNLILTRKED